MITDCYKQQRFYSLFTYIRLLLLKHPHIINEHSLWKGGRCIWVAGPVTANGNVEEQVLRLVKDGSGAAKG